MSIAMWPGRLLWRRPGVLFLLAGLLWGSAACEQGGSPVLEERSVLELETDTIRLERGVALVDVRLGSGAEPVAPDTIRIRPGDVVRFIAADARTYAVAFDAVALDPGAAAFLEQTHQLRGPPLITTGSNWVVSFQDAPPGVYPFISLSQGAPGVVLVAAP